MVEVLSPSTRGYDLGDKFHHYQIIDPLHDYLPVEQDIARVILYTRQEDHWRFREVNGLNNTIYLPSFEAAPALSDVCALIEFEPETR